MADWAIEVALFIGCLNDALYPATGRAATALLEERGWSVAFPRRQACCGQMHLNSGYRREAVRLARRLVRAFEGAERVVSPAASCVATIREAYPSLGESSRDPDFARRCADFAQRVFELSELLGSGPGAPPPGEPLAARVAYHPTCHSLRLLGIYEQPLALLRERLGHEPLAFDDQLECCGFGGTFSIKNPETSTAMALDKLESLQRAGATDCVALDNSCLMHLAGVARRQGLELGFSHLADFLAGASSR